MVPHLQGYACVPLIFITISLFCHFAKCSQPFLFSLDTGFDEKCTKFNFDWGYTPQTLDEEFKAFSKPID